MLKSAPAVMILAAGRGARCRPATDHMPKPLLPVGKTTLIEHLLLQLSAVGLQSVVINVGHLGQQLFTALGDGARYGVEIQYSWEDPVLETAGGIIQALPLLGDRPFVVVSADIWTDYPFEQLRDLVLPDTCKAHFVLVPNPPHHPTGDFSLQNNFVIAPSDPTYNYGGIGLYHPDFFAGYTPGFRKLEPLMTRAIAAAEVQGEVYRGLWVNVGTLDILDRLEQKLQSDASTIG